jgi:hypothetical protein
MKYREISTDQLGNSVVLRGGEALLLPSHFLQQVFGQIFRDDVFPPSRIFASWGDKNRSGVNISMRLESLYFRDLNRMI